MSSSSNLADDSKTEICDQPEETKRDPKLAPLAPLPFLERARIKVKRAARRCKNSRTSKECLEKKAAVMEAELRDARHAVLLASKNLKLARLELRLAEQQAEIDALKASK